jgi:hypothetical protein
VIGIVVWVCTKKAKEKPSAVSPSPESTGTRGHGGVPLEEQQSALREAEKKPDAELMTRKPSRIQSIKDSIRKKLNFKKAKNNRKRLLLA